jgi:hypothetical protein
MQSQHARKVLITAIPPRPFTRKHLQTSCLGVHPVYKSPFDGRTQIRQLVHQTRQSEAGFRLRSYNSISSAFLWTPRFYCTTSVQMTASTADTLQNQYRLPVDVKPIHYDVTIRTDLEKTEYQGFVKISLDIKKDTSRIVLNSSELKLGSAYVPPTDFVCSHHLDYDRIGQSIPMLW